MQTGSQPLRRILVMVLFALSCVGLLLFLWLSFGGTIPFNPQGYRFRVSFPNAQELATQADVRIAGVSVGHVVAKSLDPAGNRTIATIELDNQFAPIRSDTTAILREKTILGETYVQLMPGSQSAPALPDGGTLARSQVAHAVQLSEIFDAFDPATRHAFQLWQQELAKAVHNNGQNLNDVIGNLPQFAGDATDVLRVLDAEHVALIGLVQNGGTVFAALSRDRAALRSLIVSGESTFSATAAQQAQLAATFHVFPTFLNETKATMARLQSFAIDTDPLVKQLDPVAAALGPTLQSVQTLSPDLKRLFIKLNPLITVAQSGLPAIRDVLSGATPLLGALGPFLEQLNPILNWLSLHQQLTSDFISQGASGIAAKSTAVGGNGLTCGGLPCGHYLRQFAPIGTETLGLYANRSPNDRGTSYPLPLWLANPKTFSAGGNFPDNFALPGWDCRNTGAPGNGEKPVTGTAPGGTPNQACWVAPALPGATAPSTLPPLLQAHYPSTG